MKYFSFLMLILAGLFQAQDIRSIQFFNPKTNDETAVIGFRDQLILRFDDLSNSSTVYRYTIRHLDRNWQPDDLFFTEIAEGSMTGLIDQFRYSFNTLQPYTHYTLPFPNEKMRPKISGNFELIVYRDSPSSPLFKRRFSVTEEGANLGLRITRTSDARHADLNQRVEVEAAAAGNILSNNVSSLSLNVIQNNNWQSGVYQQTPSSSLGNKVLFQQLALSFPGNNEFYYFDNKNMNQAFDMVAHAETIEGVNYTYLHPVWAYPLNYQFQPDVNGAFYFRRNDLGIERDADREGDYSWVHFVLESEPLEKDIYVLGMFNYYRPSPESKMEYDEASRSYVARIYLKQGFYNYALATMDAAGKVNMGEINGNFWQTENLYQAFLYYRPFGRNYDGLLGYGEFRAPVR